MSRRLEHLTFSCVLACVVLPFFAWRLFTAIVDRFPVGASTWSVTKWAR